MNKVSKFFALSSLSALLISPLTTVSAKTSWWEEAHEYKISVSNIEPSPNIGKAIIVFFKYTYWEDDSTTSQRPVLGMPAPEWLIAFVRDEASPAVEDDICKVVEVDNLGEEQKIKVPWNCADYVVIQRGRPETTSSDPEDHFNGFLDGEAWNDYPQYGEGYNLGAPTPGFIYSQALKEGDGTTVETLKVVIEFDYGNVNSL